MSRVQLALNVSDLQSAIGFYSKLFATAPAKVRPGYANFAIAEPPLKLVLIEGAGEPGSLNHLGVEVEGPELVGAAQARLGGEGLVTAAEEGVTCCYALQDKVWVDSPDGTPWEIYTVLGDTEMQAGQLRASQPWSAACWGSSSAPPSWSRRSSVPVSPPSGCRRATSVWSCSRTRRPRRGRWWPSSWPWVLSRGRT